MNYLQHAALEAASANCGVSTTEEAERRLSGGTHSSRDLH